MHLHTHTRANTVHTQFLHTHTFILFAPPHHGVKVIPPQAVISSYNVQIISTKFTHLSMSILETWQILLQKQYKAVQGNTVPGAIVETTEGRTGVCELV